MKKLLIIFILCLCTFTTNSQTLYEVQRIQDSLGIYPSSFGAFSSLNYNMHPVTGFKSITDIDFCCPNDFETGLGGGFSLGLFYEYSLSRRFSILGRVGFQDLKGVFISETPTTISGGKDATEKYELTANLTSITPEAFLTYEIIDNLRIHGGFSYAFFISKKFDQFEEITVDGTPVTFNNDSTSNNRVTGADITNASSGLFSITGGFSYDLPMGSKFTISPEVLFSFGLTPVTSDIIWSVNSLRGGISIKYEMDRPCPPGMVRVDGNCEWIPCPENMIHDEDGDCVCRPGMFLDNEGVCQWPPCDERNYTRDKDGECVQYLYADVKSEFIEYSGIPSKAQIVTLKEYPSVKSQPLLNYIFFEEGQSELPDKYQRFETDENVGFFREVKIIDPDSPLNTYYHILDIIGYRLSTNPFASITLRAYKTKGSESNQTELPQSRIDTIGNYLKRIWGIQDNRIHTQIFNLPPDMHNTTDKFVLAETRRVEIIPDSSNLEIIYPLIIKDKTYKSLPPKISYLLDVLAMTNITDWNLTVTHDGVSLLDSSGKGNPPKSIDWDLNDLANELNPDNNSVEYKLWVKDANGDKKESEKIFLLNWVPYDEKRKPEKGDSSFAIYTFLFNEKDIAADIRKNASLIDSIIFDKYKSFLRIKGYTGIHGDENKNKILSHDWTLAFAAYMQDKNELADKYFSVEGFGSMEIYDNSNAEGRLYNKIVVVEVATPLEKKKKQDLNFDCCYVLFLTTENKTTAENVLDFFVRRNVKDIFIEPWHNEALDETYYRVISKCFTNARDAVVARAKISHIINQLKLSKQPVIKCNK